MAARCSPSSILTESAGRSETPDLFQRASINPILTAADWPYAAAHTVFNPGATLLPSGETLLLVRVEDRRGLVSHLTAARSTDGINNWRVDAQPTFGDRCRRQSSTRRALGYQEDARIVHLEPLNLDMR